MIHKPWVWGVKKETDRSGLVFEFKAAKPWNEGLLVLDRDDER